ncbi:MAG: transcriptional regulator [Phenylobacterium zucineum]|nr:MAG: transcriptional regulator [Phenylobacterium zucineum]
MTRLDYRYDECGLDNVMLVGLEICQDDEGEDVFTINNINLLHRAIAQGIACKQTGITGKELRFIRTELGFTQAEIAHVLNKDVQTVGRWERGEFPIDSTAETVIRIMTIQHVNGQVPAVQEMAKWSIASSGERPILIDASDQNHWKPVPQAA